MDLNSQRDDDLPKLTRGKATEDGDTTGFRTWRGISYFYRHPGRFWFAVFFGIGVALCFIPPMASVILPLLLLGKLVFTSGSLIAASVVIAFISGFLASQIIAIASAFFRIGEALREGFRWLNVGIRSILYWGVFVPIVCIGWGLGWVNAGFKWLINKILTNKRTAIAIQNSGKSELVQASTSPSWLARLASIIPYILWFSFGLAAMAVFIPAALVGLVFWGVGLVLQGIGKIGRVFSKFAEMIGEIRGTSLRENPKAPVLKTAAHFILAALAFPFACLVELGQAFVFLCAKALIFLNGALGFNLLEQDQMKSHPIDKGHFSKNECAYQPRCFAGGLLKIYQDAIADTKSREVSRYGKADQYKGGIDTVPRDVFNAVKEHVVMSPKESGAPDSGEPSEADRIHSMS